MKVSIVKWQAQAENHYAFYQWFHLLKANKSHSSHFSTPPRTTICGFSSATNSLTQQRSKAPSNQNTGFYKLPFFQLPVGDNRVLMTVDLRKLSSLRHLWSVRKTLILKILELDQVQKANRIEEVTGLIWSRRWSWDSEFLFLNPLRLFSLLVS